MALRLIEVVLPEKYGKEAEDLLRGQPVISVWVDVMSEGRVLVKVLLLTENSEKVLDVLEKRFSKIPGFRILLLPVEASIPRPEAENEKKTASLNDSKEEERNNAKVFRVSREELYSDVEQASRFSRVFVFLIILSSIVASVGIIRGNDVFIIGAMVIAPILGPSVALSLATALGDGCLAKKAIGANLAGILTAFFFSFLLGLILAVDPNLPGLLARTQVDGGDVALALAAGSAAVLSFTSGLLTALIGVMVAVALLPPLVTVGLLLARGQVKPAVGALLLFATNFICINLAGVITFLAQGIRPLTWWEASKAKKASRNAVLFWGGLLLALVVLIYLSQKR
ncbi:MAG: TIGR00341 family protein [Candidatus Aminicenantes bacterium]|nr:TIGR00341 family protein [Candidatus Aminicenantes bacterium]